MNNYWVTYKSDTLEGLTRKYEVEFVKVNETGDTLEQFTTHPNILYDRADDESRNSQSKYQKISGQGRLHLRLRTTS